MAAQEGAYRHPIMVSHAVLPAGTQVIEAVLTPVLSQKRQSLWPGWGKTHPEVPFERTYRHVAIAPQVFAIDQ